MNIPDLRNGMKKVLVKGRIDEIGEPRQVTSKYNDETFTVADALLADEHGTIKVSLWNEEIDSVNPGDKVTIENGYITSFRGEIQLNIGKYGTMRVE